MASDGGTSPEFDVGIKLYVCLMTWIGFGYFEFKRALFLGRAVTKGYSETYFQALEVALGVGVICATGLAGRSIMKYKKPVKKRSKFEKVPEEGKKSQ
jgi:hypothetical protein